MVGKLAAVDNSMLRCGDLDDYFSTMVLVLPYFYPKTQFF